MVQSKQLVAAANGWYEAPVTHSVQLSLPEKGLAVPGKQALHTPPSSPEYPGLQVQFLGKLERIDELLFSGH